VHTTKRCLLFKVLCANFNALPGTIKIFFTVIPRILLFLLLNTKVGNKEKFHSFSLYLLLHSYAYDKFETDRRYD